MVEREYCSQDQPHLFAQNILLLFFCKDSSVAAWMIFFLMVPLSEENPTFSLRARAKLVGAGVDDGSNFYQKEKKH